ncbi:MAG TPA: Pycsar system effector family protein [Solirubrobacter sp.]|nr:Pycsar system effector family protein [Solirubrobacter sp.]
MDLKQQSPTPSHPVRLRHLRGRTPGDMANELESMTPADERHQLAQQLHAMGKVAWCKHAWLQASLILFVMGAALLVLAFVAF